MSLTEDENVAETNMVDDYNRPIGSGQKYISGQWLVVASANRVGWKMLFFKDSILLPFIMFEETGQFIVLCAQAYYNVLSYTGLYDDID